MRTIRHSGKDWSYLSTSNKDKIIKREEYHKLKQEKKKPTTLKQRIKAVLRK